MTSHLSPVALAEFVASSRVYAINAALRRLTYLASDGSLWHIDLACWSPDAEHDWQALHHDFDGPGDPRWVDGPSRAACVERIEEILECP